MESYALKVSSGTPSQPHYSPPWADMSIIGIAGSSGSGKTSVAEAIVKSLDLPWVVILSTVSYSIESGISTLLTSDRMPSINP
jgi:uridine kinase